MGKPIDDKACSAVKHFSRYHMLIYWGTAKNTCLEFLKISWQTSEANHDQTKQIRVKWGLEVADIKWMLPSQQIRWCLPFFDCTLPTWSHTYLFWHILMFSSHLETGFVMWFKVSCKWNKNEKVFGLFLFWYFNWSASVTGEVLLLMDCIVAVISHSGLSGSIWNSLLWVCADLFKV